MRLGLCKLYTVFSAIFGLCTCMPMSHTCCPLHNISHIHVQLKCLKMADFTTMNPNCTRVMLWCLPRSVSTSFLKCMTNVPNSQCWYEPYLMACYFSKYGKNRKHLLAEIEGKWGAEGSQTADTFASEIEGKRANPKTPS